MPASGLSGVIAGGGQRPVARHSRAAVVVDHLLDQRQGRRIVVVDEGAGDILAQPSVTEVTGPTALSQVSEVRV